MRRKHVRVPTWTKMNYVSKKKSLFLSKLMGLTVAKQVLDKHQISLTEIFTTASNENKNHNHFFLFLKSFGRIQIIYEI